MIYRFFILIFVGMIGLGLGVANAQTFQFRNYDSNMGLPQNFVYSLEQGHDGFLWIGTGEGLVKYDGLKFVSYSTRDSLADDFIMTLYTAPDGKLWIGHNNGSLTVYEKNTFLPVRLEETNSPVRDIRQDKSGNTWFVVQNSGFARLDKQRRLTSWFDAERFGYTLFYSIYPIDENTLLLGTSDGLLKVTVTNDGQIKGMERFHEIPNVTITSIKPRRGFQGEFWIATEDEGFFRFSMSSTTATQVIDRKLCMAFNLEYENIQDIEEEDEGHLLVATWGNGVVKLFYDAAKQEFVESFTFSTTNGMSNNFVKDILSDNEGNYWFATYGGGLSSLVDESMTFYDLSLIGFQDNKARSVFLSEAGLWIGLENGLILADPYCFTDFEYYDVEMGIPRDEVTGFYQDDIGTIWVATGNNGLYYRRTGEFRFSSYYYTSSLTGKKINDLVGDGNQIFLATIGGFYILNSAKRENVHLTTENGLPHNNINFVYKDKAGNIWIGPKNSGISKVEASNIEIHRIADTPVDVFDMTHDLDGHIWLATQGRGVVRYMEDSLVYIGVNEGLSKNFCYNIALDKANRLWVTHFPGLSSIDLNTGEIRTFGYEQQLGTDFYNLFVDRNETIWFASGDGVMNYLPERDMPNSVAPNLNFTSIRVSGEEYGLTGMLDLPYPYKSKYKFRFEFIGISFKDPKGVTYQYKLERKGDKASSEWIDLGGIGFREYEYLPDGEYLLKIRSSNAAGVYNREPLVVEIRIAPPVWKKLWFYMILLSLLGYAVYLLIIFRERNLRRQKEALQREVDSQTVMLRLQKAEIERKNRDITDSINYAKRIQSSILPSVSMLNEYFSESFVFFAPRDIVSGDFYWFHPYKGKFLICVADCTGHGVPGAFMSMIGTTLLNDIIKRPDVLSPADILKRLDIDLKILLQKNEKDNARDGMDISVVEVDAANRKVRLASAKRPVYLYVNGELTIYKGMRKSIGESDHDEVDFINMEYEVNSKDAIYLFSDGYSDQFGGAHSRKFMTANVRKMLDEIHALPMSKQFDHVQNTFFNWKGDEEQVDDVVFMGLRL
jgi:ligand-binding sensor domain-containing protein/serine phosphatase RsbU (regulator of sigma subunit)